MRDQIQLHLVILSWGITAILGKLISLPPLDLVIWRTFLAALGFYVVARLLRVNIWVGRGDILSFLGLGWIIGWHWILFFLSARMSTASVCLAALPTMMIFCSLLEPLVERGRRWSPVELATGLVICGAVWMIYQVEFHHWKGFTVALISVFLAAWFALGNKRLAHRQHVAVSMGWQMAGGFVACVIIRPLLAEDGGLLPTLPKPGDWGWLLVLALVCTVASYSALADILRRLSVFTVNVAYNMEPLYGIILAALVFGETERMSPGFYVAAGIILCSVFVMPFWARKSVSERSAVS